VFVYTSVVYNKQQQHCLHWKYWYINCNLLHCRGHCWPVNRYYFDSTTRWYRLYVGTLFGNLAFWSLVNLSRLNYNCTRL